MEKVEIKDVQNSHIPQCRTDSGYSTRNFCCRLDLTRSILFLFPFLTREFEHRLPSSELRVEFAAMIDARNISGRIFIEDVYLDI